MQYEPSLGKYPMNVALSSYKHLLFYQNKNLYGRAFYLSRDSRKSICMALL